MEAEKLEEMIVSELGVAKRDSALEVQRAATTFGFAADIVSSDEGVSYPGDVGIVTKERRAFSWRIPRKLVAAITPFNHPLNSVAHKIAPALAAGSPVILKPSEKTPLSALWIGQALYEAGLPEKHLSILTGPAELLVTRLCQNEHVDVITFTGSVNVGKRVASIAQYKRVILELGGNDALIILPDAHIGSAVELAVRGTTANSGQRCTAVKRILVHNSIADLFSRALAERIGKLSAGNPFDQSTDVGCLVDDTAAEEVEARVLEAVTEGAVPLNPLRRSGALFYPVVLDNVMPNMRLVREETFGPVAPIIRWENLQQVIDIVNDSEFGLSAGVCTDKISEFTQLAMQLRVGSIHLNETPGYRTEMSPFGGTKSSGLGDMEGVKTSFDLYSQTKIMSLPWEQ